MNDLILASYGLLWLIVLGLAALVVALGRQIGILHTRIAPAGALTTSAGPQPGERAPELLLEDLHGSRVRIAGTRTLAQLILFVAPTCPICKTLIPAAKSLALNEHRRLSLVFASDGDEVETHRKYQQLMGIEAHSYVLSMDLGLAFEVGKLPYAVLLDASGTLRAKGLVNSREHLESLVESMDSGYGSIQEYLAGEGLAEERA